ncbi:MAG: hypothetical protein LDLANPLL_00402 [Turneriella sp.]|nr:hypothetical protein [Turneriella sp.]
MRRFLPEIFILSVAVSLSFVGYVLVDTNKDSLGIIAVTTFIGVIVMAVSLKIAGFLLGAKKAHANGKFYGSVMDWAMLLFVWPSYVTPLVIAPHLVGETPKIFSLFILGIFLFVGIAFYALSISRDRIEGKRRHAKWLYFIPSFLFTIPALLIGYFIVGRYSTSLLVLRIANVGGVLLGAFFSFYCVKIAVFDLFDSDKRKYRLLDWLPIAVASVCVIAIAEFILPQFQGKTQEVYLLFTLGLYALVVAQVLGVLSVSRRAKL